jgi:MinD superfamily P-loop ATPase
VELLKKLKIKHGVLINRAGIGDDTTKDYCRREGVPILAEIPFEREIAVLYSSGIPLWTKGERYRKIFRDLWNFVSQKTEMI